MRKHKSKGVIAALVALSFVAVACGSDETSSDTTAAPVDTAGATREGRAAGATRPSRSVWSDEVRRRPR